MTIDERIERLTERHEALAQGVELLVAENRQMIEENRQISAENRQRDKRLADIMEGIGSLVHVAEIHEHRITDLEGGRS